MTAPASARIVLAVLAALLTTGCYTGTRAYVPPRFAIPASRHAMFAAAVETARADGLRVVRSDPRTGVVEALSPIEGAGGMESREHWVLRVRDNDLRVSLWLEARTEPRPGAPWQRTTEVCEGYTYSREYARAIAIMRRLRDPTHATRAQR